MIFLTRLNQAQFVVNSDLIEHIEVTPDTMVVLTTGEKILVLESAAEIIALVVQFRRSLLAGLPGCISTNSHGYLQNLEPSMHSDPASHA